MRFLEQMGGIAMGNPAAAPSTAKHEPPSSTHSATSSLGLQLAAGGTLGGGSGPVPSNTSRFFSVDIGLFHLVAIEQNIYRPLPSGRD